MRDIGTYIFRYADAKCHLWNAYFRDSVGDMSTCEPLDSFEAIDRRLFFALVCAPLDITYGYSRNADAIIDGRIDTRSIEQIVVKALSSIGPTVPLRIGEKQGQNTHWQAPHSVGSADLRLSFIELFHWDPYGFLNLPFVRGRIEHCPSYPAFVGREALLELEKAQFFLLKPLEHAAQ
jgi:hypothetical protein